MVTIRSSRGDERGQHVQRGGLAGARTTRDDDVEPPAHAGVQEVGRAVAQRSELDQVVHRQRVGGELSDGQHAAVDRQGRYDGVHAAAVRQSRVDHGGGLVDAAADARDDLVDRAAQVCLVLELAVDLDQLALALEPDVRGAVDHDLRHVDVAQVGLQRAVAEDVVRDLLGDPFAVAARQGAVAGSENVGQDGAHLGLELGCLEVGVVELWTELLEQLAVHALLEVLEPVLGGFGARCGRRGRLSGACSRSDLGVATGPGGSGRAASTAATGCPGPGRSRRVATRGGRRIRGYVGAPLRCGRIFPGGRCGCRGRLVGVVEGGEAIAETAHRDS